MSNVKQMYAPLFINLKSRFSDLKKAIVEAGEDIHDPVIKVPFNDVEFYLARWSNQDDPCVSSLTKAGNIIVSFEQSMYDF